MDSFISSIHQNLISFFNVYITKHVNTGDRVFDTTIQMLISTLIGGVISGIIALYTKGLWKDSINQLYAICHTDAYSPLEFDPTLATGKPRNGSTYLYRYKMYTMTNVINSWFFKYHSKKFFQSKLEKPIDFLGIEQYENIMNTHKMESYTGNVWATTEMLPIWRDINGYFVYLKDTDDTYIIYSDSGEAIYNCLKHLKDHEKQMDEFTKKAQKEDEYNMSIYKLESDGDQKWAGKINARKTFNTLFFKQKEEILPVLNSFKEGTLYPVHIPMDNKLGIILYGPPGTGKTGFISALANFLRRSVLMIHMSTIKTRSDLDSLFSRHDIEEKVLVFEELDCMDGVMNRQDSELLSEQKPEAESKGDTNNLAYAMMLMSSQKEKNSEMMEEFMSERKRDRDKLDLGYLLTKLDGLESGDGRVIVATTNYPERIDSALLRPGRFGIRLNLTNCNSTMLKDILCMCFEIKDDAEILRIHEKVQSIKEDVWSPAEVLQLCVTKKNIDETIDYLQKNMPMRIYT